MAVVASPPFLHPAPFADSPSASSCDFGSSTESHLAGEVQVTSDLPLQSTLDECAKLKVYGADGTAHMFKSLITSSESRKDQRHLIIFVRHFFCGMCQEYVRSLCATITPAALAAAEPPIKLSIIGCGAPSRIEDYVQSTECTFPIYADPGRKIYEKLGLICSMDPGSVRPKYQTASFLSLTIKSIVQGLSAGTGAVKGGNFAQVGGEFAFDVNGKPTWCHRMRNSRDHTDVHDMAKLLGIKI